MAITKEQEKEIIAKVKDGMLPREAARITGLDHAEFQAFLKNNAVLLREALGSASNRISRLKRRMEFLGVEIARVRAKIEELENSK